MTDSDEILNTLSYSPTNFVAIGRTIAKPIGETYRPLCTVIGKCVYAEVMAALLDTKIYWAHSFNLHIFWWIYKVYVAGQFM